MELNKNAFPVQVNLKKIMDICTNAFKKKGHNIEINKKMFHLNIVPYWFCFYDIYFIKNNQPETISKQLALNATSNKIEDDTTYLFDIVNPRILKKIELPELEKVEIRKKELVVDQKEAETTIKKILAARHKVPFENISLSGFKETWIPFWKLETDVKTIRIDAVGTKINNLKEIPKKEKSNIQLYNEMLKDITNPKKLLTYFFMMFEVFFRILKNIFLFFNKHRMVLLVLLLLLLIWVVFFY